MASIRDRRYRKDPATGKRVPTGYDGENPWRVRYKDPDGTEVTKHFPTRAKAQAWLDSVVTDLTTGSYVDPQRGRTPFGEVADLWLATLADHKPKTVAGYESILNRHLLPRYRRTPVASITATTVRKLDADLAQDGASHQTRKNVLAVLRSVLATAVESRMLTANPAAGIRFNRAAARSARRQRQDSRVFLTAQQVRELAGVLEDPYDLLVTMAAYTGLRSGELVGLRVEDVDLLRRRVTVRRSVEEVSGKLVVGTPKNGESRSVSLPAFLCDRLMAHTAGMGQADPLFPSPAGGMLRHSNFYRRTFRPAVAAAGLPEGTTFHSLRHTCAALLIAEGAHPKAVQERLGHASIEITMDTYGHLYEDADDALADALDRVHARALGDSQGTERVLALTPNASQRAG